MRKHYDCPTVAWQSVCSVPLCSQCCMLYCSTHAHLDVMHLLFKFAQCSGSKHVPVSMHWVFNEHVVWPKVVTAFVAESVHVLVGSW